jgi:HSP20 family molecular chaperone IbpA
MFELLTQDPWSAFDYFDRLEARSLLKSISQTKEGKKYLTFNVAGFSDVGVEVDDKILRVTGKRDESLSDYNVAEALNFSYRLPFAPDPDHVTAQVSSGILVVNLESAKKQIKKVQVRQATPS